MASVHKEVHQGASQQQQPRQVWNDVSVMLADQEEPGDGKKPDQHDVCAGRQESRFLIFVTAMAHDGSAP
jgi:hypothetical protein